MKKLLTAAVLFAALATASSCLAALEYNYDDSNNIFSVTSEEIIPLDNNANTLRVAFTKEYNFAQSQPALYLRMFVEGTKKYEFADNANYWQERNYTYQELLDKKAEDEVKDEEKNKKTPEPKKLKRNRSTLIYLDVENKELLTNNEQNLTSLATKDDTAQSVNTGSSISAQDADSSNPVTDQEAERARKVAEAKALRAAFLAQLREQSENTSGIVYTSTATAAIPVNNSFWKQVLDSQKNNIPLFFEVKFWSGGANQRLWLQTEKLTELKQLLAYDLYQDEENLRKVKVAQ